ncbi:MAG: M14 family metallopeptidase, partial [Patescibacteria group bacterium]
MGTVKLAYSLINWLNGKEELKKTFTFYIIPCLNKEGYSQALNNPDYFNGGKIGRFNDNNVDLNRNFPTPSFKKESIYSFGKNYGEKELVYCGEYGGSEPEIKALINFIKNKNIKVAYFFHNAGKDVMGNKDYLSQKLVKLYSKKAGFRFVSDEEWQKMGQTGTAKEWCEINNVAYIEIEGSNRWGNDWKIQKKAIET